MFIFILFFLIICIFVVVFSSLYTISFKINYNYVYIAQSFPTPMEEPKKVLKVHYLGVTNVSKATGMEVLNAAIEHLTNSLPMEKWQFVNVAVAPSTITISEIGVRKLFLIKLKGLKLCAIVSCL